MVGLAPGHQRLAAEPGVGAQHDLHLRPALPQLLDDAADFFHRTGSRILAGNATQPRTQQLVAREDV